LTANLLSVIVLSTKLMTGGVVEKLKSTESNTVTGEAFYNREVERRLIREKIENGTHLLLTGQ
jgi:protocatechuate 3,4-dioxygenase beta subunit